MSSPTSWNDDDSSTVFGTALRRFQTGLTVAQLEEFKGCTLKDVQDTIQRIQAEHGASRNAKNMNKARAFLEAMCHIGQVIEVFLNASEFVCFVWGPIKFALIAAAAHLDALDLLLDAYKQIGDLMSQLDRIEKLYEEHPSVLKVLERYVCHVLEFHKAALAVFYRPAWKSVFKGVWKTFNTKFDPIIQDLKVTRDLLSEEKLSSTHTLSQSIDDKLTSLMSQLSLRERQYDEETTLRNEQMRQKWYELIQTSLNIPPYWEEHEAASGRRKTGASGDWILRHHKFVDWVSLETGRDARALYITGIPGAGKTVLASKIISLVQSYKFRGSRVLATYFYLRYNDPAKSTLRSLLVSILDQIVKSESAMLEQVVDCLFPRGLRNLSMSNLKATMETILRSQTACFVVVDGLDESSDCNAITGFFKDLLSPPSVLEPSSGKLRVLFLGQRDGISDIGVSALPVIDELQLDNCSGHAIDIMDYTRLIAASIQTKFRMLDQDLALLVRRVVEEARGMFLYARVVLDNLLNQPSKAALRRELSSNVFPKKLDEAYQRVVFRVLEDTETVSSSSARQIIGWICCTSRPLFWRELQSRKCIDVELGQCDPDEAFLNSCKEICGSLVDIVSLSETATTSDQAVALVHHSARQYLEAKNIISLSCQHRQMAMFCARYLTSEPFRNMSSDSLQHHARTGYYGFQDYAAAHWHDHFTIVSKLEESSETLSEFDEVAQKFVIQHYVGPDMPAGISSSNIRGTVLSFPEDDIERGRLFDIADCLEATRKVVQKLQAKEQSEEGLQILRDFYGSIDYKCPRVWCARFHTGFPNEASLSTHILQHERPYRCAVEHCIAGQIAFEQEIQLSNHTRRFHPAEQSAMFPSADKAPEKHTLLKSAARGDLAAVKAFVEKGADIDGGTRPNRRSHGITPLLLACRGGRYEVCKYLLERGANPLGNVTSGQAGSTALLNAIWKDDFEVVEVFCQHMIDANDMSAGVYNIKEIQGCSPQYLGRFFSPIYGGRGHHGCLSPKTFAAGLGRASILKLLKTSFSSLSFGEVDYCRRNELHYACAMRGDIDTIRYLVTNMDPEAIIAKDISGRTPLSYAAGRRHDQLFPDLRVIRYLIQAGGRALEILDEVKRTPLSYAAPICARSTRLLLEACPKMATVLDTAGEGPLDYAKNAGNSASIDVLQSYFDAEGQVGQEYFSLDNFDLLEWEQMVARIDPAVFGAEAESESIETVKVDTGKLGEGNADEGEIAPESEGGEGLCELSLQHPTQEHFLVETVHTNHKASEFTRLNLRATSAEAILDTLVLEANGGSNSSNFNSQLPDVDDGNREFDFLAGFYDVGYAGHVEE